MSDQHRDATTPPVVLFWPWGEPEDCVEALRVTAQTRGSSDPVTLPAGPTGERLRDALAPEERGSVRLLAADPPGWPG